MSINHYEFIEEPSFLKLKEKYNHYKSLSEDIERFKKVLQEKLGRGDRMRRHIGDPPRIFLWKSYMRCKSLQKGAREGFRVWHSQDTSNEKIHLLGLYPKNDEDPIEDRELEKYFQLLLVLDS